MRDVEDWTIILQQKYTIILGSKNSPSSNSHCSSNDAEIYSLVGILYLER